MKKQQAGNMARQLKSDQMWSSRRQEIEAMYLHAGLSQKEVAAHYGVSQAFIVTVFRRLGIQARPRSCHGDRNGRYIHGKASTLYRQMIEKDACAECGAVNDLCIHHINHDHRDNRPENLQVLCSPCHTSHHKSEWWARRRGGTG